MLDVELDAGMRAQRIVADEHPLLRDTAHGEPLLMAADEFSALLVPGGSITKVLAAGHVRADTHGAEGEKHLQSDRADIEMEGNSNQPRRLTATGAVTAAATRPGGLRENLASSTLQVDFAADGKHGQVHVASAMTPAGIVDWEGPAQSGGRTVTQRVHMTSQHWDASFSEENQLEQLRGSSGAQFERRLGNEPAVTGSSENLIARFTPSGDWSTIDQCGDVRLRVPDRTARANTAHYDRLADTVSLSGSVQLSDPDSITTAQSATLLQASNELHAEVGVSTIEIASGTRGADFGPGPRGSLDRLDGNTANGSGVVFGPCAVMARRFGGGKAETIELTGLSACSPRTATSVPCSRRRRRPRMGLPRRVRRPSRRSGTPRRRT